MEGNEAASRLPRGATIKYFSSTGAQGVLKKWKINRTQFSLNSTVIVPISKSEG